MEIPIPFASNNPFRHLSPDEAPGYQVFQNERGIPLQEVLAKICPETGNVCIFWQDLLNIFDGLDYVYFLRWGDLVSTRAPFVVDQDANVVFPLRLRCSQKAYRVSFRENQDPLPPVSEFQKLYKLWMEACEFLEEEQSIYRREFRELAGNVRYLHSQVLNQMRDLRAIEVNVEVDGKTEDQILAELQKYRQNEPWWDYRNLCVDVWRPHVDFPRPSRFVVLPADLDTWKDSDPETHTFRLYFLCDISNTDPGLSDLLPLMKRDKSRPTLPVHKHISNHPGYILVRPQEFFQKYGSYALMILRTVHHGFSDKFNDVPALKTFKILWGNDPNGSSNHFTKEAIGPLINKAIDYLEGLSLPQHGSKDWLTKWEAYAIRDFLIIPNGSNALGELYRNTDRDDAGHWTCKQHAHHWVSPDTLETLVDFVRCCGGEIDIQMASLFIELRSILQAYQFCTMLKNTEQQFHVSVRLDWKTSSRQKLESFLQQVASANVQHLELSGVSCRAHPQGNVEHKNDVFVSLIQRHHNLRSVTLFNYPRRQESYTYVDWWGTSVFRLHSKRFSHSHTRLWWTDMRDVTRDYVEAIVGYGGMEYSLVSNYLQEFLNKVGHDVVSTVTYHRSEWQGVFDLEEGTLQELQVYDLSTFEKEQDKKWEKSIALTALGSLLALTVDTDGLDIDQHVHRWVKASPQLEELNISLQESRALERMERTLKLWQGRSNSLELSLLERDNEGRRYNVAQVIVHGQVSNHPRSNNTELQRPMAYLAGPQKWKGAASENIEFLQWNSDHVSAQLTDQAAALLDMATEHNPMVLTSFVLDISLLSQEGLTHVQRILRRSELRHLHIVCTTFDPNLADFVYQVLLSVQWFTLQSLILSGPAVNEWIRLLTTISSKKTPTRSSLLDLQLKSFRIQGPGKNPTSLSHSSVLFVHELAYWNPSMELDLENVCLQDNRDSDLVAQTSIIDQEQGL
ncbi:MAG: hypothetical protein BYD32DRAFT_425257 [Podila humilis]|nr:MAG: hypothetical protein BYD32DRAFT_425257 [Podila humilis]